MPTSATGEIPKIEREWNRDIYTTPKTSSTSEDDWVTSWSPLGAHTEKGVREFVRQFMRLNVADTERETSEGASSAAQKRFEQELLQLLMEEPVEDGYSHPAELILGEALRANRKSALWIQNLFIENHNNPVIATGILKCIGRLRRDLVEPWGKIMARTGLSEPSLEIREAAVTAFELWGDAESLKTLKDHTESTPWLARYIKQVITDLSY